MTASRRAELEERVAAATIGARTPRRRPSAAPASRARRPGRRQTRPRPPGRQHRNGPAPLGSALATQRGRLDAIAARLADDEARGIARAAKRRGGRRLDEELVVDPALRAAVEAALDEAARAYVDRAQRRRGARLGARDARRRRPGDGPRQGATSGNAAGAGAADRRFLDRVAELGGSPLADAVRRDPTGAVTRLLRRVPS